MKTRSILFMLMFPVLSIFSACQHETNKKETASVNKSKSGVEPIILFNEDMHDFGNLTQGEKVSYSFVFKNIGVSDLLISSAKGSCGCTIPTYPKEPIKAKQEAKIDVVFDSEGKSGRVEKTITLVTNCNPSSKVLTINSNIIVPE